jgi:hypothetical protein
VSTVKAAADVGQQPGEQLLDRSADGGGDLVMGNGRLGAHLAADDPQATDKRQPAEDGRLRRPSSGPALRKVKKVATSRESFRRMSH